MQLCNAEKDDTNSRGKFSERIVGIKVAGFDVLVECILEGIHLAIGLEVSKRIGVGKNILRAGYIINRTTRQ